MNGVIKRGKTWSYVIDLPPVDGKRRQRWVAGFKTEREAKLARARELSDRASGRFIEPTKTTVAGWFAEWLPAQKPQLAPSSFHAYEWAARHILAGIGDKRLQQLTSRSLETFYGSLKVSPKSVNLIATVTGKALKAAVRARELNTNPASDATAPKVVRKEMVTWSGVQVRDFLDSVKDDRLAAAFTFLATSGCRRGEVLGLRWRDVDTENGWTQIRQQVVLDAGTVPIIRAPKGAKTRMIALDGRTAEALREHRLRQLKERHLLGLPAQQPDDLVFSGVDSGPVNPQVFSAHLTALVKRAGLPRLSSHGFRHTWASLALQSGEHPKVVQERLGHASISITLDTYSHSIPAMQTQAASRVADAIFGA